MAKLLVSVRSADEARAALAGGAAVIDVKEPDRGPLGRADVSAWDDVRRAVAGSAPISVALGELRDWTTDPVHRLSGVGCWSRATPHPGPPPQGGREEDLKPSPLVGEGLGGGSAASRTTFEWPWISAIDPAAFAGLAFRKLGLAGVGDGWEARWASIRRECGPGPAWIAVAYADWMTAGAPHPDRVLDAALAAIDCAGVLVDTWDKSRPGPVDGSWSGWIARAKAGGRLVALAGGLDEADILRLAPMAPDLFAVRGAACHRGDRRAAIDPDRVARLARAAGAG